MENLRSYLKPGNAVLAGEINEKIKAICNLVDEIKMYEEMPWSLEVNEKLAKLYRKIEGELGMDSDYTYHEELDWPMYKVNPNEPIVIQYLMKALPSLETYRCYFFLLPNSVVLSLCIDGFPRMTIHFEEKRAIKSMKGQLKVDREYYEEFGYPA